MRVFIPNQSVHVGLGPVSYHSLPFEIDQRFIISHDELDSDIIPIMKHDKSMINEQCEWLKTFWNINKPLLLILRHTHLLGSNEHVESYLKDKRLYSHIVDENRIFIVHTNFFAQNEISYNFLFDRTKLYYTDYKRIDLSNRLWTNEQSEESFYLDVIPKKKKIKKKWLTPNRWDKDQNALDKARFIVREKLEKVINMTDTYYGNPSDNKFLPTQQKNVKYSGWTPISNYVYNTSLISAYVETVVNHFDNFSSITEKTYDPLIKGHYILPFSHAYFIEAIKEQGFILPQWINYSYDNIENDERRWEEYVKEYKRLDNLDLRKYYDSELLKHNRSIFYTKGYDDLYKKINQKIDTAIT